MKDIRNNHRGANKRKRILFYRKAKRMLRLFCRCLVSLTGWISVVCTPMIIAAAILFG